jgi:2-hydroxychromene-2-carboxylate isomerase
MPDAIDFWFALSSPSSYLASLRIDDVAGRHGRDVRWRPFDIRKALEAEGIRPNVMYPRKGAYARRDWDRTARLHEHAYRLPEPFGRSSLPAAAIAYRAEADGGPRMLKAFCRAVMAAYFTRNEAIDDVGVLIPLAAEAGLATDRARAAPDDPTMQAAVASATQTALDEGIWGAPVMVVDGEPFWGEDRIDQLDLWLARGGW